MPQASSWNALHLAFYPHRYLCRNVCLSLYSSLPSPSGVHKWRMNERMMKISENNLTPPVMHGWDILLHICTLKRNMMLGVSPWTKNSHAERIVFFKGGDCEALSNNERFHASNYRLTKSTFNQQRSVRARKVSGGRVSWEVAYLQGTFSPLVERLHARAPRSGWRFPPRKFHFLRFEAAHLHVKINKCTCTHGTHAHKQTDAKAAPFTGSRRWWGGNSSFCITKMFLGHFKTRCVKEHLL